MRVSLIGALVLWILSVGAVRGFAFMLGISTLVDVVTAYVFTRPLVILLGRNRLFTEAKHLGVAEVLRVGECRIMSPERILPGSAGTPDPIEPVGADGVAAVDVEVTPAEALVAPAGRVDVSDGQRWLDR